MEGICIIGVGASTPLGGDAATSAAAHRAALCSVAAHPVYLDSRGDHVYVSRDRRLAPTLHWRSRVTALATAAVMDALPVLQHVLARFAPDVDVLITMPEPRPGADVSAADDIAHAITALIEPHGHVRAVRCAWKGHASGLLAIRHAVQQLATCRETVTLIVSVDSYVSPETLEWLDATKQLKRDGRRSAFPPGEAAAALLLARGEDAARWRTPVLGEIISCGAAREPHRIKTDAICVGEGLTAVLRDALQPLQGTSAKVTDGYCDLNGERYRSEELMFAIVRVSPLFENAAGYATPADCFGDVGAASGPLFAALAIVAAQRGYAKGELALVWAGSENGERAAVLLRLPVKQGLFR